MVTKYVILIPVRRLAIFGFAFLIVAAVLIISSMGSMYVTPLPVFPVQFQ